MTFSILDAARAHPERIGVIVDGAAHSYASLAERTRSAMAWLRARGVESHDDSRVALVGTNTLDTVVLLYALLELGAPVVMVHPRLTAVERAALLADARPRLVVDDPAEAMGSLPDRAASAPVPVERTLAILYTSGTTGQAKGAALSRRAFAASAQSSEGNLGWLDDDRWLLCMPLAHVGGLSIVVRTLLARRCLVLDTRPGSFDPEAVAATIAHDRVTLLSFVPTTLKRMLDAEWPRPAHVRAILLGGAFAPGPLVEEAADRQLPVLTTYGLTEACSQVTTQRYGTRPSPSQGAGEPIAGVQVRIDGDEILVRGPTLMSGYVGAAAPESSFRPDGWFATGDLGRLDDEGRLHLLARRQDLIVTGGENVYPLEVEAALASMPGILEPCVIGIPDDTWGALVAVALVAKGSPPEEDELVRWFAEHLAPHKRPRRIAFLPELPRGSNGKVDRARTAAAAGPLLRPLKRKD